MSSRSLGPGQMSIPLCPGTTSWDKKYAKLAKRVRLIFRVVFLVPLPLTCRLPTEKTRGCGSKPYHFRVGAPPILVYFGDWDVHWGYDLAFDPWPHARLPTDICFSRAARHRARGSGSEDVQQLQNLPPHAVLRARALRSPRSR